MKNTRSYRLPALLLAVIMVLSMLPVASLADTFTPYSGSWKYSYTANNASFAFFSDGTLVSSVAELNPDQTSTMTVTVPDSEGLPADRTGETVVAVPEYVVVTRSDVENCDSADVNCDYRASSNSLVFTWKNGRKAGFSATFHITTNVPATVNLSGRYVVTTTKDGSKIIGAMKAQERNDKRLTTTALSYYEGKLNFDNNDAYLWTFTRITGDWYVISNQGRYLKMVGNALTLTDRAGATNFLIYEEGKGLVLESNGYYLNTKGDNVSNGMQGSNWSPRGQWVKLYSASEVFDYATSENGYVKLNPNGGSVKYSQGQDVLSAKIGSTVTLPNYTGTKNGSAFIGWAKYPNIYVYLDGTNNSYCEVYLPGTTLNVSAGQINLYAVFNEKGTDVQFGFRKDGKIPDEPSNYEVSGYDGHMTIKNTLKIGRWVVDVNANKPIVGNHIENDVTANLVTLPTDEQIKKAMPSYDPETMYVHWYVLKYAGKWKVDGVLRQRASNSVTYSVNVEGTEKNSVQNPPLGYEFQKETTIRVGAGQNGIVVDPSRPGYTFEGWNTKADGTGTAYASGTEITAAESITFYAQWKEIETYQVSYTGFGFDESDTETHLTGDTVTLAKPVDRDDYVFSGWQVNGEEFTGTELTVADENVVIEPVYYGPIDVEIASDWQNGMTGYKGAKITLTAILSGADGLDCTFQWQYRGPDGKWVDIPNETKITMTYELDETTSARVWRVIVTGAKKHQD